MSPPLNESAAAVVVVLHHHQQQHQANGHHRHSEHRQRRISTGHPIATTARHHQQHRSPKKFFVFPVDNVHCAIVGNNGGLKGDGGEEGKPGGGAMVVRGGRLVTSKQTDMIYCCPYLHHRNGSREEMAEENSSSNGNLSNGARKSSADVETTKLVPETETDKTSDEPPQQQKQLLPSDASAAAQIDVNGKQHTEEEAEPILFGAETSSGSLPSLLASSSSDNGEKESLKQIKQNGGGSEEYGSQQSSSSRIVEYIDGGINGIVQKKEEIATTTTAKMMDKGRRRMGKGEEEEDGLVVVPTSQSIDVPRVVRPSWTSAQLPAVRAKVILLGESGVGKTSIVYAYKYGFPSVPSLSCRPTIGAHYTNFELTALGGLVPVQLQLWDTAGQERFRSMVPMYLRNVGAAVLVYDISNRESFDEIDYWLKDVWRCSSPDALNPLVLLIGNKTDQQREVTKEEGMAKALRYGTHFFEVTAIDTSAVRAIFQSLAEQLAHRHSPMLQQFDDSAQEVDECTILTDDGCPATPPGIVSTQFIDQQQPNSVIRLDHHGRHPLLVREFRELTALWSKCQQVNCCGAL